MKTIEYHGVVRRIKPGRADVEIQSVSAGDLGIAEGQVGQIVSVRCHGRALSSGDRVVLTETVIGQEQVLFFGLFLPVVMGAAIFFAFLNVSHGDDRLAMTLAAVFLFPYYSILLLMKKYLHKEHAYRLKK
jgi:hypothetical protein